MDKLMSIREFAERNNVGRSTVYRENKAGRLPFVKVGRATRIRERDAEAWQDSLDSSPYDPADYTPDGSPDDSDRA